MLMRKVSDNKKTKRMAGVLTKAVAGTTAGMMTMAAVLAAVPVNVAADEVIMEWREENGVKYWYENGVRQGVKYNADGSIDISYRGKEIYDPSSAAWYWLDCVQNGAVAKNKDVYQESAAGQWGAGTNENGEKVGKWVRYDENGHMVKGWQNTEAGTYYFDPVYGTMAKGDAVIDGQSYYFNKNTGILERSGQTDDDGNSFLTDGWHKVDGVNYWYENGVRQGVKYNADGSIDTSYRGKEIYDPSSAAWYWLDCVQNGAVAKNKDVYQESAAGQWGAGTNENGEKVGKWVRYDENGHMVKGWQNTEAGTYYFDTVYGTMAKGTVDIDGKKYEFDSVSGKFVKEVVDDNNDNNNNNGNNDKKDNFEWSISDDGKLTVTGSCAGKLYTEEKNSNGETLIIYPWDEWDEYRNKRSKIKSAYINVTGLTDMREMFYGCIYLTSVDLSDLDTSNVTDMSHMFSYCYKLSSVDVSGFDTSNVTDMSYMFSYCDELSSVNLGGFDTSNVTDMGGMFYYCRELSSVDVSGIDTSNVMDMNSMFYYCRELSSVDVGSFDTSNVTDMSSMFSYCNKLSSVDVSGFDTSNVTDMSSMFSYCKELSSVDVSGFGTSNVTSMRYMFEDCSELRSVDVSGFDTSNVTDMNSMFRFCSNLSRVDVSSFDTSNVMDMRYMFTRSENLTEIIVGSGWDTSNASTIGMFSGCGTDHVTVK